MAKWGEGDPRWIVEERADATNVNNWHWTERDVTAWSSNRLRQLLLGVRVEGSEGVCEVTEVSRLDGEASINNRKGKLFFFYEFQLRANWLGTSCSGLKYRGTVDVPNLSDENDEDDLDISVSLCKDQPSTPLLDLMKSSGGTEVRRVLGQYVRDLKSDFSQGMILPTADGQKPSTPVASKKNQVKAAKTQVSSDARRSSSPATCPTGVHIQTCSFGLKETFQTSAEELYRTFINQEFVQVFTRSAATVDARRGGKFLLLDGSVSGEFTELVPDQRIEMRWRFRTWPSGESDAMKCCCCCCRTPESSGCSIRALRLHQAGAGRRRRRDGAAAGGQRSSCWRGGDHQGGLEALLPAGHQTNLWILRGPEPRGASTAPTETEKSLTFLVLPLEGQLAS
ncbi:activator of 90 kDa heat shock protein ATPase homolog 1-like isoform X2 [Gambusia affinis]|uniref:activator of 90 kDa heat shock protein ATPase homolog 1-like isoform X2 n=1 Tax=Gambusia affinis TaxID=33528 RepID=UPI001CDBC2FC|nr:activator of 90 kDa heat shock protein ATPase homolog 1-like isoform X2 [Gambusia affinis]